MVEDTKRKEAKEMPYYGMVLDEVLDSEVFLLPGPMSGEEEEVFPVAGLTEHIIRQHLDGRL